MGPLSLKGYLVQDKIKDGTVGTVWRATDTRGNTFALKQISLPNARNGGKLRQFKKEATLTKGLKHPNIIRVFDYVDAPPQPFFLMEFFDSENLKWTMAQMPERVHKREFHILMAIADALAFVHTQGIVHKDIKPENVLINADSDVRLIDFSLAQTKWDRMLQFGKRIEGTPMYMAPEQIRGEKCDQRTDMYSFGVMMYELMTKRPPFTGSDPQKLLEKHLEERPIPMSAIVPTMAPELDKLVLRLLAKNPDHRFPDMSSVMQELSRWIKQPTVLRLKQIQPGALRTGTEVASSTA
ncbi:MAG TPA: serine/threonine-protein kinase [Planctomycetota bacterium]|nr:serine/threonine-protein kinase [Planctomycetota bacterium]